MAKKYVYFFGGGKADGNESMKNLLGGKGANLAEMAGHKDLRLPVPPGFTITTDVCTYFYQNKRKYPSELKGQVTASVKRIEVLMGKKFGDVKNPLLVSVRSGARKSMPGMMETVLNVGLTEKTIPGLIEQSGNERFVYDAYRRLIMMYSDVVMEKAAGIEPEHDEAGIRKQLEKLMAAMKKKKGVTLDTELDAADLKELCSQFKNKVKEVIGKAFPDSPEEQLWGGISAVFASWMGKRAVSYRRIERIPEEWGTAVNVQTMVFGNMGEDSATGVAFTRNPGNGENKFYGEFLINAQGEDVVAGIRTPAPINESSKSDHNKELVSLEKAMPAIYKQLFDIQRRLEKHYKDMQDIEFTIEKGRLFMLQCRVGKRNGPAAVRMAADMVKEKFITADVAVTRVTPAQLDELLHPVIDPREEKTRQPLAKGLPAGPGGASGMIVFSAAAAVEWAKEGKKVILVREETNPEDVEGMRAAQAILTARGGMTSHAALVARGWGKCCIVGCGAMHVDYFAKTLTVNGKTLKEGEWITLNGTKGLVYEGQLPMMDASEENAILFSFLKLCDGIRRMKIRTNADTPADAKKARMFGAEGIGLFRTEHMFYGKGSEQPLFILRKMIISKTVEERRSALAELFPFVKSDIKGTLEAMDGFPVTVRLLDPPLHEFVPRDGKQQAELAKSLNISLEEFQKRADALHESNPMMGHRGVRLGVTYPEVTEMQVRAILEAAAELVKAGKKVVPEIMIPVICTKKELDDQKVIVDRIYGEVLKKYGMKKFTYLFGTMIEIPRAALTADVIAETAEFFSFGTNDLTQMSFGFSRDDIGGFLPAYLDKGILADDPFQTIDQDGVGQLIKVGIERGRKTKKDLKIGICGEHGGEAKSVEFCHNIGMNYVSCSPFRVPIARLAAAQAVLKESAGKKKKK
ncbi:MAG: pyruvate, phosphate dikinase [Elusimicrobia bacterium RIFOXYA2_FULL_50_26]|nr:MAG: pyruvate, phosphate dikinase [Elusimicrobia bacterium RIFOXYA2_FULL_50_26]OGS22749.1 MAG: pyruvate, phosphate dikinase [Elusimicrobia bacterium RIFOXYB2_FULL_50_12]